MAVLYLALDPAIDRLVALKLLRVIDEELRDRFMREARHAARFNIPTSSRSSTSASTTASRSSRWSTSLATLAS